uniref:WD40 repeat-like protein n=1 Tax=Mycena chlorophos TaxID=658473 RepID=A0ABQ0M818_MYCCL|nr:predicted protein [Mycena chlorophos]
MDNLPTIRLSADEINCLVYAFLLDSGFHHSAFSLCTEAQLESSPNFSKHIPRGELVELLSKSLLYREVEAHWKADNLALNCKVGFSLLEPHICSLVAPKRIEGPPPAIYTSRPLLQSAYHQNGKRRGSPLSDGPADKRARWDENGKRLPTRRVQGPADQETDPRAVLVLPGHGEGVFLCAFNPVNPDLLITSSRNAVVHLWDLPPPPPPDSPEFAVGPPSGPHQLEQFRPGTDSDPTTLSWSTDGSLVAIGCNDANLRVFKSTGEMYFTHTQHQAPIYCARFSKSGKWLLTASLDGTTCLWDVDRRELRMQYFVHQSCCLDVEWLSETMFVSSSADGTAQIMRIDKLEPLYTIQHDGEVNQARLNPSRTRLTTVSDDMTARVYDVEWLLREDGAERMQLAELPEPLVLSGHTSAITSAVWCPDLTAGPNELLATGAKDNVRLWDSRTGACLHTLADHKRDLFAIRFSPSGRFLATAAGDGWLHVYDVKARELEMRWSWYADYDRPGVLDLDWQTDEAGGIDRIAMALELGTVAVVDVRKVPALQRK